MFILSSTDVIDFNSNKSILSDQASQIEEQKTQIEEHETTIEGQKTTIEEQKTQIEEQKTTIGDQAEMIVMQGSQIDTLRSYTNSYQYTLHPMLTRTLRRQYYENGSERGGQSFVQEVIPPQGRTELTLSEWISWYIINASARGTGDGYRRALLIKVSDKPFDPHSTFKAYFAGTKEYETDLVIPNGTAVTSYTDVDYDTHIVDETLYKQLNSDGSIDYYYKNHVYIVFIMDSETAY